MESKIDGEIVLDPEVVKTLRYRIYYMERENHKTKKYKDNELSEKIRKLIESEVDRSDY